MTSGTAGVSFTVAVTGATGFLGRHVVAALVARGCKLRLLARREPVDASWGDATPDIVLGALDDSAALRRLVTGADAVLHLAGAIKAYSDEAFMRVNRDGTRALAEAMLEAGPSAHLIHVSSLAARHPELSGYAASKRASEEVAFSVLGAERVSVIRPPAIYGPGDRETMVFFELASRRFVPLPGKPAARISLVHVADAAALLAVRTISEPSGKVQSITDACPEGYGWKQILGAAAEAVGNRAPAYFQLPAGLLRGVGGSVGAFAKLIGRSDIISAGKIRELLHEDWAVPESELLREPAAPPQHSLLAGFASTAKWYRQAGWL